MTTTAVDKINGFALESLPPEVKAMFERLEALAVPDDSLSASLSIMATILSANTEEEIFAAAEAGTISSDDWIDTPFNLRHDDVTWCKSSPQFVEEGAMPYFARIRTVYQGVPVAVSLGGVSVVPTLFAQWEKGIVAKYGDAGMPLIVVQERTNNGFNIQKLRKHVGKTK